MIIAYQLILILLCLMAGAFFAGMETGVISIHRMRLRHFVRKGAKSAKLLQSYLDDFDRLLGTTLVGTNFCVVIISVIAASLGVRLMGSTGKPLATAVVAIVVLIFGEYMPKAWFHSRPIERCSRMVGVLRACELLLKPVSVVVIWLTRLLIPGTDKSLTKPVPFVTKDDLKVLAREGEKDGVLSSRERVMIHRVIELSGKRAGEIMIPRDQMTTATSDTTLSEFFNTVQSSNFTRMPVWDPHKNCFTGIINLFYVLSTPKQEREQPVSDYMRRLLLIPEKMPVDDILPRMRRFRQPMCLVHNEAQEVIGLITTEDILKEIVGEL